MSLSGHAHPHTVLVVVIVHTVIGALVVAARLYARLGIAKNAGLDDLFIGLSFIFALATTIAQCIQVKYGVGQHQASISPEMFMSQTKALYVSIWNYNLSLSSTKISILLQYLRIFPQRGFRIACHIMLAVVVIYSCYTFFTAVFMCSPIPYFWDMNIKGGKCLNRSAVWLANAGLNITTDIATAVLPLPILSHLELPKRQRRALMIVFGLGGFTCIVSIFRLQSLYRASTAKDISWENPLAAVWSNVEIYIAIVCSCLPTLRCLFPKILKSQISISRSRDDPEDVDGHANSNSISGTKNAESCGPKIFGGFKIERVRRRSSGPEVFAPQHARQKSSCTRAALSTEQIEFDDWAADGSAGAKGGASSLGRIHVTTAIEQEIIEVGKGERGRSPSSRLEGEGEGEGDEIGVDRDGESTLGLVREDKNG